MSLAMKYAIPFFFFLKTGIFSYCFIYYLFKNFIATQVQLVILGIKKRKLCSSASQQQLFLMATINIGVK